MPTTRVALLTDTYFPCANGVAVSVSLLQRELNAMGYDAWVIAPRARGLEPADRLIQVASTHAPIKAGQRLAVNPFSVKLRSFDIIHTHTTFTLGVYGLRFARMRHIPHVSTYHTHLAEYAHYVPGLRTADRRVKVVPRVVRAFYGRCDHVIAPSSQTADLLRSYHVTRPIDVIPTGVDLTTLQRAPVPAHLWPAGSRRLLSIGRLAKEKHVPTLIAAMQQMRQRENVHLVIVGDGPAEHELKALARLRGMAEHISFVPSVDYSRIGGFYQAADAFVFASPTETQGLVVQEAQLMGLPVIAVNEGGVADIVADGVTGFLVSTDDALALARRTLEVLADGALADCMRSASRERSHAHTARHMAEQISGVYERLLTQAADPAPRDPLVGPARTHRRRMLRSFRLRSLRRLV